MIKIMPETSSFFKNLDLGVAAFQDLNPARVVSVSHNDGDGITASALICKTMDFMKIARVQLIFERSETWASYFTSILEKFRGIDCVFITDLGAEEKQLCDFFGDRSDIQLFILDHHKISESEHVEEYPDNVHSMNPTRFGLDGLRDIAGSTLTYLFCERLTPRVKKLSWLPAVGMAGDVLKTADKYASINKDVLDIAIDEGTIQLHDGIAMLGGMAEQELASSLTLSLLPFLQDIGGNQDIAIDLLSRVGIAPSKNILALNDEERDGLVNLFGDRIAGKTAMIPGREGILCHTFEFNFLIGIVGDTDAQGALELLDKKKPSKEIIAIFHDYLHKLVTFLGKITGQDATSKETAGFYEGDTYKFFELGDDATKQLVSDLASFTSVNYLLSGEKLLVIAAKESDEKYKLSFRCSPEFVSARHIGMGTTIEQITKIQGGRGGGHDLAAGWTVPAENYKQFCENLQIIDKIIKGEDLT
jgi:single-stranded-DNA-specific exonuclease